MLQPQSSLRLALPIVLATLLFPSNSRPLFGEDATETRPNVLMILVDDLKPTLGCYGDSAVHSPNIDALARRGMRFELAYCNQAVCAPSRFTLMLGSHSTSTGLYGLGSPLRQVLPDATTLPQYFARHGGYRTESLGKVFHIGHGNQGDPQSFSVPHFKDKVIEYLDADSTDGGKLTREEALFTNQKLDRIRSLPRGAAFESPDVADDDYADGRVAQETIRRLRAAKERRESDGTPFFIAAGFVRPHLPFSAPKRYWDLYDPGTLPGPGIESFPSGAPEVALKRRGEITAYKPVPENGEVDDALAKTLVHGYYASTSYVDAQIGKVVDELDRLGLDDNTIIVLWGDHGFHLGDHGIWTKHTNYEQANRIPILISAPGVTRPGSVTRQLAETVDIYPTLVELAGLPSPDVTQRIDGVSLVPVLKDPSIRVRDHAFHAYPKQRLGRAIRTQRYRMVQWLGSGQDESSAEYELYDYQNDPHESRNLAGSEPMVLARLQETLRAYPKPVGREQKRRRVKSPSIADHAIEIKATVKSDGVLSGVVLAQGGNQQGYAVHFVNGVPRLDVRINGAVTQLVHSKKVSGKVTIVATINNESYSLVVNGVRTSCSSVGLIPKQPVDGLSIGKDDQSAAGEYLSPNPFSGKVLSYDVQTRPVVINKPKE